MTSHDVIDLYKTLENLGIEIWLDGGWGVDALLGRQTRNHEDVDIVVQEKDVDRLKTYLQSKGYVEVIRDDSSTWNFVFGNNSGRLIDVHVVVFDEMKNGIYGPSERGVMYPSSAFGGVGTIDNTQVKCLTPEYQLESHSGYRLDDKDYDDIAALREKFNL